MTVGTFMASEVKNSFRGSPECTNLSKKNEKTLDYFVTSFLVMTRTARFYSIIVTANGA